MSTDPWHSWFPFNFSEFMTDPYVQALSMDAKMGTVALIAAAWRSADGMLPRDEAYLQKWSYLSQEQWQQWGPKILRYFEQDPQSKRLSHPHYYAEWQKVENKKEGSRRGAHLTNQLKHASGIAQPPPKRRPGDAHATQQQPCSGAQQQGHGNRERQQQQQRQQQPSDVDADAGKIAEIGKALEKIGILDSQAAVRILAECGAEKPNVTVNEIVFWIGHLWAEAERAGERIRDHKGYVIVSVSRYVVTGDWQQLQAQEAAKTSAAFRAECEPPEEWPPQDPLAITAWRGVLNDLEIMIPQSFETWLKPNHGWNLNERTLYVRVPSPEFQHIGEKYDEQIKSVIRKQNLPLDEVKFVCNPADISDQTGSDDAD